MPIMKVFIDEVPEGNWAAAGRTISLASIADSVGLSKTGSRFAWLKTYFAAKARVPLSVIRPMPAACGPIRRAEKAFVKCKSSADESSAAASKLDKQYAMKGNDMLTKLAFALVATALAGAAFSSEAMPIQPAVKGSPVVIQVADGCGPRGYRGPNGACHSFGTGPYPDG